MVSKPAREHRSGHIGGVEGGQKEAELCGRDLIAALQFPLQSAQIIHGRSTTKVFRRPYSGTDANEHNVSNVYDICPATIPVFFSGAGPDSPTNLLLSSLLSVASGLFSRLACLILNIFNYKPLPF